MPDVTFETEMVINECFGGFRLSNEAAHELARRKGLKLVPCFDTLVIEGTQDFIHDRVARNDPDMIDIVRSMGGKASGDVAKLVVKKIVVTVDISNHDGYESVRHAYVEEK